MNIDYHQPSGSGIVPLKSSERMEFDESNENEKNPSTSRADEVMESLADMEKASITFTLDLHRRNNFTRTDVRSIQDSTQQLYSTIAKQIENLPLKCDAGTKFMLNILLEKMVNMFTFINTDFKLFRLLQSRNLLRLPTIITIEKTNTKTLDIGPQDNLEIGNGKHYISLMDLEFQLKTFFECGNVLKKTLLFMKRLEDSDRIKHYVNGSTWNSIRRQYPSDIVIPLSFYADEYEVNDVLSSHNKKDVICGLYYNCLTIPDEYCLRLCNIFIAGAIKKWQLAKSA